MMDQLLYIFASFLILNTLTLASNGELTSSETISIGEPVGDEKNITDQHDTLDQPIVVRNAQPQFIFHRPDTGDENSMSQIRNEVSDDTDSDSISKSRKYVHSSKKFRKSAKFNSNG